MSLIKLDIQNMTQEKPHTDSGNMVPLPRLVEASAALAIRSKAPPRQLRVKTGCLTCRRRKKKCDESKPRCAGCRRNQLPCEWPTSVKPILSQEEATTRSLPKQKPPCRTTISPRADPLLPRWDFSPISDKCRASGMTKESSLFLRHYASQTGLILAVQQVNKNPFITHILPLACSDDLLMHSILAVSGTHLASRLPSSSDIERSTLTHYVAMVEGVRTEMSRVQDDDFEAIVRLFLILIMLCHYQIMEGSGDGKFYAHLMACQGLIRKLFEISTNPVEASPDYSDMLGFCLELFAYIMASNHVSPHGTLLGKALVLDIKLLSHNHLSRYRTFGTMFGDLYGLYQFMPQIAQLATIRLEEEASGTILPSEESRETYRLLESNIANWRPPMPRFDSDMREWQEQRETAEVIRRGLYIYLLCGMAGSVVSDFETLEVIQTYANTMLMKMLMLELDDSKYQTLFMWPAIISGSCLIDVQKRKDLVEGMKSSVCQAAHVHLVCHAMELLWMDPDPRAFGPYGLARLKETHGIWIPML